MTTPKKRFGHARRRIGRVQGALGKLGGDTRRTPFLNQKSKVRRSASANLLPVLPLSALGLASEQPGPSKTALRSVREQDRRVRILNWIRIYTKGGYTRKRACEVAGISTPTAWRWERLLKAEGVAGLRPKYHLAGRRSPVRATPAAIASVERIALQLGGRKDAAWLQFCRSADCPSELAREIRPRTGKVPQRLLSAFRLRRVPATLILGPTQFSILLKK